MRRHGAALVLLAGLLGGCALTGGPDQESTTPAGTTTEGASVSERVDEATAREQAPRVRAILQDLWNQFDLEDKPPLDEEAGDGGDTRMCTLDVDEHITAWAERAGLRVSQEEDVELEEQQAQLVRVWLDDNGWERIDSPAPDSSTVTYHRDEEGFTVTVAPQDDARVFLDVSSPCYDEQGQRVAGATSSPDA